MMPMARSSEKRAPAELNIYLFSEGHKTEPSYLQSLIPALGLKGRVTLTHVACNASPAKLLKAFELWQKKNKGVLRKHDKVWIQILFDDDGRPDEMARARMYCARNSGLIENPAVHIAYMSPCFEIWLLLHFDTHVKARNHTEIQTQLSRHLQDYNHERSPSIPVKGPLADQAIIAKAIETAKAWQRSADPETRFQSAPRADIWPLIEHLLKLAVPDTQK